MTISTRYIVPIVEGPGDVAAAPVLMRRILHERIGRYDVDVLKPKRARDRGALVKRLEDFMGYAAMTDGCSGILVLLDADKDCPMELGAALACRARSVNIDIPTAVVCAKREYENWFLASDDNFEGDVENYGGAKRWLTDKKPTGLIYRETKDQPSLSATMDIEKAFESSRSFRRLCDAVNELVQFVDTGVITATPSV